MKYVRYFLLVAVALFAVNAVAFAEPAAHQININMEYNSSKYISMNQKIIRIFVGNGSVVHVHQPSPDSTEFIITSQGTTASTTIFIWTEDGRRHEYLVNVSDEQYGQAKIIEEAIGLPNVHVRKVGDRILLTGTVKNQFERNHALQTARLYVGSKGDNNLSVGSNVDMQLRTKSATNATTNNIEVNNLETAGTIIDLLEMENPIQIRLEAQVVEINTEKAKDLGIQYGVSRTGGIFYFGEDYERSNPTSFRNNPAKWFESHFGSINAQITALVTDGKARILSRPNITTMSGEQATINIGGQIPYQSTNSNGSTNTEFKDYGIILQFKPVLDAQGRITMAVHAEVSSLSGETVDGQPIISTRFADSVVNVFSGSAMVIGGLMDSSESKNINKIPLLGDIPILGEFFKYTSKSRDKRELMIIVTPHIVEMGDTSRNLMSDEMREYYYNGQRERNAMHDTDLNALPPPFTEEDKDKNNRRNRRNNSRQENNAEAEQNQNTDYQSYDEETPNVEVFGEDQ